MNSAAAQEVRSVQSDSISAIEKLLKDQKYDAALAEATKATRISPNNAQAFFLLGRAHFYLENDDDARVAFAQAIELNPAMAEAHFFRGLTFNYGEQKDAGRHDFEKATEIDPNKAKYWLELGKLHERAERNEAARTALEKAVALDPTLVSAWFSLGAIASGKGEREAAALMWEKTLKIDPSHADAHYNLGTHHQVRGDATISLKHFLAASAARPQDFDTVKKLIQAYYRLGDFDNAAVYRLKLLDLIAKSDKPKIRSLKEFCFDQFDAPGGRFFVYESLVKDAPIVYWFTFKLVDAEGKVTKTINLESSKFLIETGMPFILAQTEGATHTNFGIGFEKLPPYPALKELVLKANKGELTVAASSTLQKKSTP